ncbi:MAG TPA: bifunctional oligoribonuclease/PAP phosphatase NrnA, partial [Candidatus Peregrinibacteria bacterium]|nr:bifunctional oligoribonuclease/PAP phosphatase NrnA [Candidatus Peregrinibacteria bacterium]
MELSPQEQIVKLIKESQKVLLVTHVKIDGDALGSSLGMFSVLKNLGKEVTAVCADPVPETFHFLPDTELVQDKFSSNQDFIISLDCKDAGVERLKYNLVDNKVNIVITPKKGSFSEKNVSFRQGTNKFDLIIALDVADLDQMGKIYTENTELFFQVPVINIDHHASNTSFGKVNLVNITASSTTEILYSLVKQLEAELSPAKPLIDKNVATFLLAGIITDTGSFQNPNTTPQSFEIASELLLSGAQQQDIIKHVYRTKNLSTLKLWGQILSKIQTDPQHRIVWSTITKADLVAANAKSNEANHIIDELLINAPDAEVILLLKEEPEYISGSLRTTSPTINAAEIAEIFGGGGHLQAAGFKLPLQDFRQAEREILEKIREYQKKRLPITEPEKKSAPVPEKKLSESNEKPISDKKTEEKPKTNSSANLSPEAPAKE